MGETEFWVAKYVGDRWQMLLSNAPSVRRRVSWVIERVGKVSAYVF
jgi:hypothetical protein